MQLLLLITGLVLAGYVVFSLTRGRKKKQRIEEFDQTLFENSNISMARIDPLLDDYQNQATSHHHSISQLKQQAVYDESGVYQEETHSSYVKHSYEPASSQPDHYSDEATEYKIEYKEEYLPETEFAQPAVSSAMSAPASVPPAAVEDFIAFTIIPKQGEGFSGDTLLAALKVNYFYYGKQKIFHRHVSDNPHEKIVFSLASLVEPGYFELANMMNGSHYAGLLMFMLLPCSDPLNTFEKMFTTARQLAATLNGELCDDRRKQLTIQMLTQYRDRIRSVSGLQESQRA